MQIHHCERLSPTHQQEIRTAVLTFLLDMQPKGCIITPVDTNNDNAVFRALADPTRRLIIDDLNQKNGQTLFEICGRLSQNHNVHMARQSVTKHLGILEAAGILTVEWQGRTKVHFLNIEPIQHIGHTWLNKYL